MKKKLKVHLIHIREWPKNNPPLIIFLILLIIFLSAFYSTETFKKKREVGGGGQKTKLTLKEKNPEKQTHKQIMKNKQQHLWAYTNQ